MIKIMKKTLEGLYNYIKDAYKKWLKRTLFYSAFLLFLFFVASIIIFFYISNYSNPFIYNDVEKIPENKVGLVLGTSPVTKKGDVSLFFTSRMIATKELIDNNKINYILVSGDNKTISYNEPKYMRNYLLKLGIDEGVIIADYGGRRTLDSVIRSNEIFQQDKITVISQKFHNQRAIFIARKNGIDAIAFNAEYPYQNNFENIFINTWTFLRELLARDIAIIDFLTNKKPTILGTNIEIKNKNVLEIKKLILEK
ncbi:MAG: SanA protein [Patescibacteria group bacterium]|nr:SanA protein [Patescibacteria group bacterium]